MDGRWHTVIVWVVGSDLESPSWAKCSLSTLLDEEAVNNGGEGCSPDSDSTDSEQLPKVVLSPYSVTLIHLSVLRMWTLNTLNTLKHKSHNSIFLFMYFSDFLRIVDFFRHWYKEYKAIYQATDTRDIRLSNKPLIQGI